ncbi:chitin synthase [Plectosphaerella cucumerina]|uniref:chitin synthase n=1 Tax=Plectosphaerella cucumerina TaxID=40658 RepID=A0A8K0X8Y0_9PEZI|nr:chitin synthase [Plectosphaerella cucumerina]
MANNRMSMYSMASESLGAPRATGQQSTQVSTTTLLNAVHNIYLSSQPYRLDAGTSIVANTWLTASQTGPDGRTGGTVDPALSARAWEHARRRAEDGTIILGSLHTSTPSVLTPFLSSLPMSTPSSLYTALNAIQPFLRCSTPYNPSTPRQGALAVALTLNLAGNLTGASVALSQGGIDTVKGLLNIPAESGYRAFDVFYYLLTSASTPAEREFLGLKAASNYTLLARSGTYDPPSYLPTADDAAAADDFRSALKDIGIKGSKHRDFISTLAGLLKLGNTLDYGVDEETLEDICEDVSGLLGLEPEVLIRQCNTEERSTLVGGLYEALVDWVIAKANTAIAQQMARIRDGDESLDGRGAHTPTTSEDNEDTVCITVVEVPDPSLGKALAMRGIFDDTMGINAEMIADGVEVPASGSSVIREMQNAVAECSPDLGITTTPASKERQHELEKREVILEKVGHSADDDAFVKQLLFPVAGEGINLGNHNRIDLPSLLSSSRVWYHLSIHPTDDSPASLAALPSVTSAWSAGTISRQLRAWRLPEWANRRNKNLDFTSDFDVDEFVQRYATLGCREGREGIETFALERGWSNGEVIMGKERIWMRETAWWEAETMLDVKTSHPGMPGVGNVMAVDNLQSGYSVNGSGYFPPPMLDQNGSQDGLMAAHSRNFSQGNLSQATMHQNNAMRAPSIAPTAMTGMRNVTAGDYGLGRKGDNDKGEVYYNNEGEFIGMDPELANGKTIETSALPLRRRVWVAVVWTLTFWIPSPLLRYVGRMRRPDVRMAWREKLVLCFIILLINGAIVFWIVGVTPLTCPNFNKAFGSSEVEQHTAEDDFWVSIHGKVYDITKFWRIPHSDINIQVSSDNMMPVAGMNLDDYFQPPLTLSCPGLGISETMRNLEPINEREFPLVEHISGYNARYQQSALRKDDWYTTNFLPTIKEYYKGDLVWPKDDIASEGLNGRRRWAIYDGKIYDLSTYFNTTEFYKNLGTYNFLSPKLTDIVRDNAGTDITEKWDAVLERAARNETENQIVRNSLNCIQNTFYMGIPDFREEIACTLNNWFMLAFTIILCSVILVKFLAALQFGSKKRPTAQDKFVICQVPAYTEGEDSLRKALDSLTALQYDNKRKLICVICDGVIVGQGNDRPTPKIVLDILGVDPKVDPPALPFKSVGTGSEQLNYGKVYSGLYEFEGNVVPYIVVVKVGKESEQSKTKPGNRGKRDSQITLMSFLNRVHHRSPMNPLELEMFHQINNIIGVDPELYEYLLMVDADTCVWEDSLTRLVAACANDGRIAGICGETALQNDKTWWTMIQVYEYFISHHLSKAFESLFGSVTCLPGCFTMYRLRTPDKGKPLIISDAVIKEYSVCEVDTLHKKNLLSLGEDRYLTTLMTKHFPMMSYKFIPDAYCQTAAPESWSVLLSQRRRWINSTIHNLMELMRLKEMCGFCCFSMRFVVFIDLFGTIILPATFAYLVYLIYRVASKTGPFPMISIIMLAAVYGLQALIFILKRQWQHIGWMIIYLLAFPIFSLALPVYSFWNQDNFSWGNTRIVIGEKGNKQIVAVDDEEGFDPRSIPLQRWDDYATANNLPGRRGGYPEKHDMGYEDQYEMDEMKSVYSSVRPGSVLTGMQHRQQAYMPPHSPAPFGAPSPGLGHMTRHSTMMSNAGPFADPQHLQHRQSMVSMGQGSPYGDVRSQSPYADFPGGSNRQSAVNLRGHASNPSLLNVGNRSSTALGLQAGQSTSSFDFQRGAAAGPDDMVVVDAIRQVLAEVDLDTVTKKQVRALVEQRLQTELVGERRTFMDRQIDHELANM